MGVGVEGPPDPSGKLSPFDSLFQTINSSATHVRVLESVSIRRACRTLEIIW